MQTGNQSPGEPRQKKSFADHLCNGLTFVGLLVVVFFGGRSILAERAVAEEPAANPVAAPEEVEKNMPDEAFDAQDIVAEPAPEVYRSSSSGENDYGVAASDSTAVTADSLWNDNTDTPALPADEPADEATDAGLPADTLS